MNREGEMSAENSAENSYEEELLHEVVVSLGSNEHPRCRRIEEAIATMRRVLSECEVSDIYETPEIHGFGDPYMNAVLAGRTRMNHAALEHFSKQYELGAGRDVMAREEGRVPIDIDIVIWDGTVVRPKDYAQSFFRIGYTALNLKSAAL